MKGIAPVGYDVLAGQNENEPSRCRGYAAPRSSEREISRRNVFLDDGDRETCPALLSKQPSWAELDILGYSPMTNPVNSIVVPKKRDEMAIAFRRVRGGCPQWRNIGRGEPGALGRR